MTLQSGEALFFFAVLSVCCRVFTCVKRERRNQIDSKDSDQSVCRQVQSREKERKMKRERKDTYSLKGVGDDLGDDTAPCPG